MTQPHRWSCAVVTIVPPHRHLRESTSPLVGRGHHTFFIALRRLLIALLEAGSLGRLLQYTQTVQLVFNGLSWPHVTVGTLKKV